MSRDVSSLDQEQSAHFSTIYQYIPEEFLDRWTSVPAAYYSQDDVTLHTLLKPTDIMVLLRKRFQEMVQARVEGRSHGRIHIEAWCIGICVVPYLVDLVESERGSKFMAWCSIPSLSYDDRVDTLVQRAFTRLEEIIGLPFEEELIDKNGDYHGKKVSQANINLFLKAFQMLDMRSRGQYTQRVEQKTMQVTGSMKDAALLGMNAEELDRRLAELEGGSPTLEIGTKDVTNG